MALEKRCSSCGMSVGKLCAACWRCENCGGGCNCHMERKVDGVNNLQENSTLRKLSKK